MKTIEGALAAVDGYLISIARDTVNGWYELEIGLPPTWVIDENEKIGCEVLIDEEEGKLIRVSPKNHNIVIDDLVGFVEIIVKTNAMIAEKEKQFTDKMEEMKKELEAEAREYYQELDELKEESFKKVGAKFVESLPDTPTPPKSKRGRPKGSKNAPKEKKEVVPVVEIETSVTTTKPVSTVTEETTDLVSSKE